MNIETITPRWLTLKQAMSYCNLGRDRLKKLVICGKIKGGKNIDKKVENWFFDRLSIDAYMDSMSKNNDYIEKKAFAILRKVKLNVRHESF